MKKIFKSITFILSLLIISVTIGVFSYSYFAIRDLSDPEIQMVLEKEYSTIYDNTGREIETLGENKKTNVKYNELPQILINALISIEDTEFYYHDGLNYKRIITSLIHNLTSVSTQGGSTLTQQLIKNLLLTNEQSLKRKIQEAYLAILLEQKKTKEEILELYFNEIYFESTIPGISYASQRFFGKDVALLTLPECAMLVGLVKSPSYYNPYTHLDRCESRKNIVLDAMQKNNYITDEECNLAKKKKIEEFLLPKGTTYQEETFDYQAYLDIVYQEVEQLTGYNPFSVALEIETYLDTSIQSYLDKIQKGKIFKFEEELQQIGACIVNNHDASIIGVIGGRNYDGMMLYNRAYQMKRQPASTMKPIFAYALAMEYLNYHEYSLIEDKAYTYPGTNITVQNADKNYLGTIPLVDAIGYSRNTSTLFTLENVINKIGQVKCIEYLKNINIMDNGTFSYPYAIGGMSQGVSPTQLAGAYAMLARGGNYLTPSTIKSIRIKETGELIYSRDLTGNQVLTSTSAYLITSTLEKVIDANYYNIAYAKPKNIKIAAKTGTNAYDDSVISHYKYPSYADRDVWFSGYSKNFTISVWSGFDEPKQNEKTYFGKNDNHRLIVKDIFRTSLEKLELDNQSFNKPSSIKEVNIVKGIPGNYLPNDLIPSSYIVKASFKQGYEPTQVLPYPSFQSIENINIIATSKILEIDIPNILKKDDIYNYIFGKRGYLITYEDENSLETTFSYDTHITLENKNKSFTITIVETYENNTKLTGETYIFSYEENSIFDAF